MNCVNVLVPKFDAFTWFMNQPYTNPTFLRSICNSATLAYVN